MRYATLNSEKSDDGHRHPHLKRRGLGTGLRVARKLAGVRSKHEPNLHDHPLGNRYSPSALRSQSSLKHVLRELIPLSNEVLGATTKLKRQKAFGLGDGDVDVES
jgi:hypothetical protein